MFFGLILLYLWDKFWGDGITRLKEHEFKTFQKIFPDFFPKWLQYFIFPAKYEKKAKHENTLFLHPYQQ